MPRTLHFFAGVVILLMGLAVLWARSRPLLPSVLAAGLSFLGGVFIAVLDQSDVSWRPHYVLMGVALLTSLIAATNGALHARD